MTAQVPPQSLEAERSVLGAMLVSESAVSPVIDEVLLKAEDFYLDRHRVIFASLAELHLEASPTDEISVIEALKGRGELEKAGERHYISELAASVAAVGNAAHHARIVRDHSRHRAVLAAAQKTFRAPTLNGEAVELHDQLELLIRDRTRGLRTRSVLMERVRPIHWLWRRRIPLGLPSLIVGEEGIGKGTTMAWVIARATRGELDGDRKGEAINVLVVGDEDGFESVWVPRVYTAGGDLERLRTLDEGEDLDDLSARDGDLAAAVQRDDIGLIVLDQVLDHVSGGQDGSGVYNPKNVRQAMMPLRRVAGTLGVAAVCLLHPNKARATSFRELVAGSHQFNAVSRSSLFLGVDPVDQQRLVLVRGKGNHSAAPRSFEFRIGVRQFELNGHAFEMPIVEEPTEGDRTIDDFISAQTEAPRRNELAEQLAPLLGPQPIQLATLAEAVGRNSKDRTVRLALKSLAEQGRAIQTNEGWLGVAVPGVVSGVTPYGGETPDTGKTRPDGDTQTELVE